MSLSEVNRLWHRQLHCFCQINFLHHFFPVSFVHFDFHDLSAPHAFTSRKTSPEISKNTTTNSQTRSDCLILLIACSPFNVLSGITVACSSCRGPLPSGSGRPAISFPLLTLRQLMHYSWRTQHFLTREAPLPDNSQIFISPRAASLWPTAARQFSSGHCTTHASAVRHKKALGDHTLHLDWLDRSACQCWSAPRVPKQHYRALHRAEQPSVLRGMLWTYRHSDLRMSFSHQATANSATTTSNTSWTLHAHSPSCFSAPVQFSFPEIFALIEGLHAKRAYVGFWPIFIFLQDRANFSQTDLFWHETHHSTIVLVDLRFILQK